MGWIVKSESDIERVWVEVDDQLREIPGRARVEMFDRTPFPTPMPTPRIITRVEPWYRRPAPFSALVAATTTCTIETLLHILSHVL